MLRSFLPFILSLILTIWVPSINAQTVELAKPGPEGIFLFPGKFIPSGKIVSIYKIERRELDSSWKSLAEVSCPATFRNFLSSIDKAKKLLPSQPLPSQQKLQQLFDRARQTGTIDSLKGMILHYPVRMALGIMYHDSSARSGSFQYRISALDPGRKILSVQVSERVSMPHKAVFDDVTLSESSRSDKSVYIKWMTAAKNPSPLFMVHKIENGKVYNAGGTTGRYTINDTTYFTFRDSIKPSQSEDELQYYFVPFDLLGNAGNRSQVTAITFDHFNKAVFHSVKVAKLTERFGNTITWQFSDPKGTRSIVVYRSEWSEKGFIQLATLGNNDTLFIDDRIKPEKDYYYFIQANASNGSRYKQSNKVLASAFNIRKLKAPFLTAVIGLDRGVRLDIDSIDTQATGIRVFRKKGLEGFQAISDFISTSGTKASFIDIGTGLESGTQFIYSVRVEKPGYGISDLSNEVKASTVKGSIIPAPGSLRAAIDSIEINLFWEDIKKSDSLVAGYMVSRRIESNAGTQLSPFSMLAGLNKLYVSNYFLDQTSVYGKVYTYQLQSRGVDSLLISQGKQITVSLQGNTPLPPFGLECEVQKGGSKLTWIPIVFKGVQTYKIYRWQAGMDPTLVITLPATATEFFDASSTGFQYYITSCNANGEESVKSKAAVNK